MLFRSVKNLQELLYSSIRKRYCIGEKRLKELLEELKEKSYIEITPDKKKPDDFKECRLKMARRLREFQQGSIRFYFSVANALIDGKISQVDYLIYIALVNNLDSGIRATYDELSKAIGLDELTPNEIGKHIRKLRKERCLIVEKQYTDKGYEWNKYKFINPYEVEEDNSINSDLDKDVNNNVDKTDLDEERLLDYEIVLRPVI